MSKTIFLSAVILILGACSDPSSAVQEVVAAPKLFDQLLADSNFVSFTVHPDSQVIRMYWLGANDKPMRHFNALEGYVKKFQQDLVFAMNGGMYTAGYKPVGLYVERAVLLNPLDTNQGDGNFYLLPNGVFSIDTFGRGSVSETSKFMADNSVAFATQSGPMLLIDGKIHPAFREKSTNLNVRNGVGILPDGRVHLVMSKRPVNFYNFAQYFKALGCDEALYLDGFVSRVYDNRSQERGEDGRFGVMIGVSEDWED